MSVSGPKVRMRSQVLRLGRRIAIGFAGGGVVMVGAVLSLPLVPGPGVVVMVLGLGILSLEFERPRTWLDRMKAKGVQLKDGVLAARERRRRRH